MNFFIRITAKTGSQSHLSDLRSIRCLNATQPTTDKLWGARVTFAADLVLRQQVQDFVPQLVHWRT